MKWKNNIIFGLRYSRFKENVFVNCFNNTNCVQDKCKYYNVKAKLTCILIFYLWVQENEYIIERVIPSIVEITPILLFIM